MFRLKQTLHAQRRLEALLQGRRSRNKDRRAGRDPRHAGAQDEGHPPPSATNYLNRRRRRQKRYQAA